MGHAERIVEAEQREAQLAKLADSQREELARLREQVKTMRESNSGETEAQLYAEIEQLSDAYSKLEQQISDTVNQSKQRERVHRATLAEKQKLVQQNHLAKKQQELLRAQAQNYERTAAQAKSRVKAVEQRVDTLEREINSERTEVTKLRNTVSELRALQTNVGDQTAAVNQLRQQLSEAQNEVITLRSAATEQQASQRRLEDENARLQRELDALKTSIRDAGGNASRVQTKRMEKLYKELEKSLRCPVLPNLWKDVILIKCGHMFSSQAMQEALAKRNRKCPVCKTRYDKADIMPITIFQRNEVSS